MYFPNAFKKVYIAATNAGAITVASTGTTANLTAGVVGLFDAKTYAVITAAPSAGTNEPFILAQGSYHTIDKIGPFHGGYQESIKSKTINPKYISRLIKVTGSAPKSQIVALGWTGTNGGTDLGMDFQCGKTYYLRVDLKGSPALRFLSHNLYRTFDAFTGCCASNCNTGCTGDPVDATVVNLLWADQINNDPIFKNFISASVIVKTTTATGTASSGSTAVTLGASNGSIAVGQTVFGTGITPGTKVAAISGTALTLSQNSSAAVSGTLVFGAPAVTGTYTPVVYDATANSGAGNAAAVTGVVSSLVLQVAYVDTVFGNCTFTTTDKYDLEPLFIYLSVTDETGDPCAVWPHANTATGLNVAELQTPKQAQGVGETVLRDLIMFKRYLQEPFHDNSIDQIRMREVEDDYSLNVVTRSALYDRILILHHIPRLYNSSGIYDNDQYLLEVIVPTGTTTTALTNLIQGLATSAGNTIAIENY